MKRKKIVPPCQPPADEDQAKVLKVMNYAGKLDLYGVVMLAKQCPGCGAYHGFHLLSNLPGDKGTVAYGENLAALLRMMADEAQTASVTILKGGEAPKETLQ